MTTTIILTAYDWTDIEDEAKEAGVTSFCSKPLFMSELRDALTKLGEHTQEQDMKELLYDFSGRKVLVVEDNELNQEIAVEILRGTGFILFLWTSRCRRWMVMELTLI